MALERVNTNATNKEGARSIFAGSVCYVVCCICAGGVTRHIYFCIVSLLIALGRFFHIWGEHWVPDMLGMLVWGGVRKTLLLWLLLLWLPFGVFC